MVSSKFSRTKTQNREIVNCFDCLNLSGYLEEEEKKSAFICI